MALNEYDDMMMKEKEQNALQANIASAPTGNKYDQIAEDEKYSQRASIAQSMTYAVEKEPSRMAKAIQMAKEFGVDADFVDRNMETIEKKNKTVGVDYDALMKESPGVAKFFETPENAALGRDDMDAMKKIDAASRFIPKRDVPSQFSSMASDVGQYGKDLYQAGDIGWNNMTSNLMALTMAFKGVDRETIERQAAANKRSQELSDKRPDYSKEFNAAMAEEGADVSKAWNRLLQTYDELKRGETLNALKSFVTGEVTLVAEGLDMLRHIAMRPKGLGYSVSENAVNAIPSMGLGFIGAMTGPAAPVAFPMGIGMGSAVVEIGATLNSVLQEKGVDITDPDQLEAAYRNPQIMADVRSQALKKGISLGTIDALSAVVGGKVLRGATAGATRTQKAIAGAKGVGFEMATEAGGEAASQAVQHDLDLKKVDVGSSLQEGFTSLGQSVFTASKTAAVRGEFAIREMLDKDPVKAAHQVVSQADNAIKSLQAAVALQDLGAAIKETKNIKQVPGKLSELVEAATGGKGTSAVYFQTDDFDNYWKKRGESPSQKAGEIMGDNGKAYEEAKQTGGLVEIPLEQFASSVGATDDFEGMLPIARVAADGMSLEEAKQTMSELPSVMKQLALEATATQDNRSQIRGQSFEQKVESKQLMMQKRLGRSLTDQEISEIQKEAQKEIIAEKVSGIGPSIQEQLVAAGRPVREAKYAAQLVEAFFRTTAQKLGMNPEQLEEFITKYKPTINQGRVVGEGQTFNQVVTTTQVSGPQVSPLGFYSQVEAEIQKMDFKAMPGKDLSGRIKNIAGIKKEELEFLGLNEWLETQEGKVTKEDVVNFIREHGLVVDQIVLSEEYNNDLGLEDEEIKWSEPERDHSYDDDDIYNETQLYLNEDSWREEQEARVRAEKLEEFTDDDGVIDEAGLKEAIYEEVQDLAEKAATEAVESDDWPSARFDVRLDVGYDTFYLNGSDEMGWYSPDVNDEMGYNLAEAKIKLLAALADKGKISINKADISRAEDVSWKHARAKTPSRATMNKKIKELMKTDKENLLKKAREEYPHEYEGKTEEEIAEADKYNLEHLAREAVEAQYADANNKKNVIYYILDHPVVTGKIEGNNVKGWTLYVDGESERVRGGGTLKTGSIKQKLEAKDIEEAKEEALKVMIDNKVVKGPKTVEDGDINKPSGSAKFERYIKEGESSNYREFLLTLPKNKESFVYPGHFSQKNVVAHARVTDRVDANGKKTLFIEEVQSDWHQQGRERGYKGEAASEEEIEQINTLQNEVADLQSKLREKLKSVNNLGFESSLQAAREIRKNDDYAQRWDIENQPEIIAIADEYRAKASQLAAIKEKIAENKDAVADAPLKNTEAWVGLVMKRMIRLAVEQGYDSVSWSPASFQVERWGTDDVTWVRKTTEKKEAELAHDQQGKKFYAIPVDALSGRPLSDVPSFSYDDGNMTMEQARDAAQKQIDAYNEDNKGGESYFLVGSTEQSGGIADGANVEELARMRGQLLERRGEKVTNKEELLKVVQSTLGRERSAKDLENLTNNIWEQMQIKDTGQKAPRKEGMQSFYDKMIPKVVSTLLKKLDKDAKVTTTKIKTLSGMPDSVYVGPDFTLQQINEFTDKALNDENASMTIVRDLKDLAEAMRNNSSGEKTFAELASYNLSATTAEYIGARKEVDESRAMSEVWNVELTDTIKQKTMEGFALFQGDPNTPLGRITFGQSGINIDLLQGANPSTFMHEMAHAYLQIMTDLQDAENVPQNVKDDFAKILEFLEVESAEKIDVEAHEKFARAFEAYLREGKAPSNALKKAFVNFKSWLLVVYRTLRGLNVELTDEVRGVFDRLLATEEQIAEARGYIAGEFNLKVLDLPTEDQQKYLEKVSEWKIEAEEQLASKLIKEFEKRDSKEYKNLEEMTRATVESEVNQMKIYKVMSYLENGTNPDGSSFDSSMPRFKIDKQAIRDNFPKGTLPRMKKYAADAGGDYAVADPSVIASLFGYNSGRELVDALINTPTKDSFIDSMTEQRMNEQFPDLANDDGMLFSEAMRIVHEDKGAQVKRMELEMIAKKALPTLKEGIRKISGRIPSNKQIRAEATRIITQSNQESVKPIVYLRAERKFAKQAGVLLARGDFEGAFEAKRKELYNYELYKAASDFNEQKIKKLKFFKKVLRAKDADTAKTRDNNLVKASQALISRYMGNDKAKHPSEYLSQIKKYDEDAYNSMMVLIDGVMVPKESLSDLTVGEFMELSDAVQSIWDFSKTSQEIIVGEEKMSIDSAITEIIESVKRFQKDGDTKAYDSTATDNEKLKMDLLGLLAAFTRFETLADIMGDTYRKFLFTETSKAEDRRAKMADEYKERIVALSLPLKNKMDLGKKIKSDELKFEFKNLAEVIGALYHTGNESNLQKLLVGRGWGVVDEQTGILDTSRWDAFVNRLIDEGTLTKEHFDYVQAMWDINEELKPMAQKSFKRIFGYYFEEITTRPFSNKLGTWRGGYAPAKIDPHAVTDIFQRQELENFIKANPTYEWPASGGRGFTMKRVDSFNKPLSLDMSLSVRHVDDVIRFSIVKPAVVDAAKIITNQRFREELGAINPKFVNDLDKVVKPALNRADKGMAKVDDPSTPPILVRGFRLLQTNAAMQIMVGNVVNTLEQLAGPIVAMSRVDARYMAKGLFRYMTNPKKTAKNIEELSLFMRNRNDTHLFEMDKQARLIFTESGAMDSVREFAEKHGYFLQSFTQQIVDNIVWQSAYEQSIAQGMSATDAVDKADSEVRMSQGGRRAIDISAIESNQWLKFFNMFMGFFNMLANMNVANFTKLYYEDMGMLKKYSRGMYLYATGFASVAIISGLIRKLAQGALDADDDDEYLDDMYDIFIGSQIDLGLALIPVAGTAVKAGLNQINDKQYDDRVNASPAITAISAVVGTGAKAATGKLFDDKNQKQDVRDALTALGIVTGVPTGALSRPISYEMDRQSGRARPSGPIDAVRGYTTGKPGVRD